jgi:shikimate kinase
MIKSVVLMGYMGSGKSSVASVLANKLKINTVDLDLYIVKKEGISIPELFKTKGEIYFRKKEREYLKNILEETDAKILSLGGGTPCYGNNLELIKNIPNSVSFYLSVPIETLTERLWLEKNNRPLISHFDTKLELNDFIRKHIFERSFYYNQAQHVIQTKGKSLEEVAVEIQKQLI